MSGSGGIGNRDFSRGGTPYTPNEVKPDIQTINYEGRKITVGGPQSQGYMQMPKDSGQSQPTSYSRQRPYPSSQS